jgi:Predicted membrane protein (DUF2207)
MLPTLLAGRDRLGHSSGTRTAIFALAALTLLFLPARSAAAASQEYTARRYDVNLEVLAGGDVRVSEVVTFDFQSGTFRFVWRTIPATRTDGIEIVEATMDGVGMTRGTGPGQIEVTGSARKRIEWHFEPISASTHTFGLTYVARGVGITTDDADLIAWMPLPNEHSYQIEESRITVVGPSKPTEATIIEPHAIDRSSVTFREETIEAHAGGVRRNGRLTLALRFPRGTIVSAQPQWRRHGDDIASMASRWILAAASVLLIQLFVVFAMRRQSGPPIQVPAESTTLTPPEPLPPALAMALITNGSSAAGATATLMDLADRGVLTIQELPRHFGVRHFVLAQVPGAHELASHEQAAIEIAFDGHGDDVTLSKAQGRLARGGRRFSSAVAADMQAEGLLDETRYLVAQRLKKMGFMLLLGGIASAMPIAAMVERFGPWPLLIPLAIALGGLAGIIAGATTAVLSSDGAMRAARWRGFRRYLKSVAADDRADVASSSPSRFVVYAVALGLARPWSRLLKRHPGVVPPWFVAATQDSSDAGAAFAAFVSSGGHGSGGAGAASAGGGGSGAG